MMSETNEASVQSVVMRAEVKIHDKVSATYDPLRTDDLTEDARQWIGVNIKWFAAWEVEEGHYKGRIAMTPFEEVNLPPIGWVPLCDLKDIKSS